MWDGIYWLWDNLSEVSALLLLIKYYKKLDAKWAEKKKVKGHFTSWCHALKQAKKNRLMLPVAVLFWVKLYMVELLSKIADKLPRWVQM